VPAHILIAGAGIGGLTAALALTQSRRGHRVDVLEQAVEFAEIGAGVQLGPNATRRLRGLGLGAELDEIAAWPSALVVRSAGDGSELARLLLGDTLRERYGAPYQCVHRADLHAMLVAAVRDRENVELWADAHVNDVHAGDDTVCAATFGARAWEGDGLVGADGLWSKVRSEVDPHGDAPRATGHTAWRGLVDQSVLRPAQRRRNVEVWLGPKLHAVAYPVRGGRCLNVVVLAEASPAGDADDWDQASSLGALHQAIGQCGMTLQALLEEVSDWRTWTLSDRAPLASPAGMVNGRVALLGDAAHPMLPYLAQGAGMAIEDAIALADALAEAGPADVSDAFARYAAARWQRNAHVQSRARRNGTIFHALGPMRLARDLAMRTLGSRLLDQPWLYAG
jgi:salicylate hydroxylase